MVSSWSAVAMLSLIRKGIPCKGPRTVPAARSASACAAIVGQSGLSWSRILEVEKSFDPTRKSGRAKEKERKNLLQVLLRLEDALEIARCELHGCQGVVGHRRLHLVNAGLLQHKAMTLRDWEESVARNAR